MKLILKMDESRGISAAGLKFIQDRRALRNKNNADKLFSFATIENAKPASNRCWIEDSSSSSDEEHLRGKVESGPSWFESTQPRQRLKKQSVPSWIESPPRHPGPSWIQDQSDDSFHSVQSDLETAEDEINEDLAALAIAKPGDYVEDVIRGNQGNQLTVKEAKHYLSLAGSKLQSPQKRLRVLRALLSCNLDELRAKKLLIASSGEISSTPSVLDLAKDAISDHFAFKTKESSEILALSLTLMLKCMKLVKGCENYIREILSQDNFKVHLDLLNFCDPSRSGSNIEAAICEKMSKEAIESSRHNFLSGTLRVEASSREIEMLGSFSLVSGSNSSQLFQKFYHPHYGVLQVDNSGSGLPCPLRKIWLEKYEEHLALKEIDTGPVKVSFQIIFQVTSVF